MSLGAEDIAFVRDLFSSVPDLSTRKMFGGLGIYSDGVIFALMRSDGQVLLKATKGPFADHMATLGSEIWSYTRKNGTQSAMPYWTLPESALDDPEEAQSLAHQVLTALSS